MNLIIILIIILIILGTKFVNYYHKFFYIYKQLDNNEKIKYFSNTTLIKLINNNSKIKSFIIIYLLTPFIKINYLIMSALIYLMYAVCENELDNIILNNGLENTNNYEIYELNNEKPVINFVEINKPNYLSTLTDDIELFTATANVEDNQQSENNAQFENNIFLNNEINQNMTEIINNNNNINDLNIQTIQNKEHTLNENLDDYIIENPKIDEFIINNVYSEDYKDNKDNENKEKKKEIIKTVVSDEPVEIISIEEVDFGDYMTKLINNSDKKPEEVHIKSDDNKMDNNIPIKIKIGKKKNK